MQLCQENKTAATEVLPKALDMKDVRRIRQQVLRARYPRNLQQGDANLMKRTGRARHGLPPQGISSRVVPVLQECYKPKRNHMRPTFSKALYLKHELIYNSSGYSYILHELIFQGKNEDLFASYCPGPYISGISPCS